MSSAKKQPLSSRWTKKRRVSLLVLWKCLIHHHRTNVVAPCYPQTSLVSKHRINLLERKGHFGYGHCPWYIMIQYHPPSRLACSILRTLHVSPTCNFLWQTKKNLLFANPCHHPSSHHSAYCTANCFFKPRSIPTTPTPSSKASQTKLIKGYFISLPHDLGLVAKIILKSPSLCFQNLWRWFA